MTTILFTFTFFFNRKFGSAASPPVSEQKGSHQQELRDSLNINKPSTDKPDDRSREQPPAWEKQEYETKSSEAVYEIPESAMKNPYSANITVILAMYCE